MPTKVKGLTIVCDEVCSLHSVRDRSALRFLQRKKSSHLFAYNLGQERWYCRQCFGFKIALALCIL